MGVNTVEYGGNLQRNTDRGPSRALWDSAPVSDVMENPALGMYFWDDFTSFPDFALNNGERQLGQWDCWVGNNASATIGTGADATNLPLEGGVIGITGGTTAIDVTMTGGVPAYRFVTPAAGNAFAGGKLWFEASIAVSSIASAALDLFVGLMDAGWGGTHISSAASLCFSATNTLKTAAGMGGCIGFWKRATTNPTDIAVAFNSNNGTVQLPGSSTTLQKILTAGAFTGTSSGLTAFTSTNGTPAANSFVKVGMLFDPTPSCPVLRAPAALTANQVVGGLYSARVQFFVNGQVLPWFLTTLDVQATTFSSTFMVPVIGYRSGGSSTGIGYCDFVRVLQLANT